MTDIHSIAGWLPDLLLIFSAVPLSIGAWLLASAADARKARLSVAQEVTDPARRDAEITEAKAIFAKNARLGARYCSAAVAALLVYVFLTYAIPS